MMETINKLYLELSQIATATTESELKLLDKINEVTKQRDELLRVIEMTYKMLLSEPDTKGALFKAENLLRDARASIGMGEK
jgi:hypothetical protein